jgi:hypothetical protein
MARTASGLNLAQMNQLLKADIPMMTSTRTATAQTAKVATAHSKSSQQASIENGLG